MSNAFSSDGDNGILSNVRNRAQRIIRNHNIVDADRRYQQAKKADEVANKPIITGSNNAPFEKEKRKRRRRSIIEILTDEPVEEEESEPANGGNGSEAGFLY